MFSLSGNLLFGCKALTQGYGDKLSNKTFRNVETIQPGLFRYHRIVLRIDRKPLS